MLLKHIFVLGLHHTCLIQELHICSNNQEELYECVEVSRQESKSLCKGLNVFHSETNPAWFIRLGLQSLRGMFLMCVIFWPTYLCECLWMLLGVYEVRWCSCFIHLHQCPCGLYVCVCACVLGAEGALPRGSSSGTLINPFSGLRVYKAITESLAASYQLNPTEQNTHRETHTHRHIQNRFEQTCISKFICLWPNSILSEYYWVSADTVSDPVPI